MMVTHDVDEAVLLSDRIVMMTNGPAATIGEVLRVDLPRPRNRVGAGRRPRTTCSSARRSSTSSTRGTQRTWRKAAAERSA